MLTREQILETRRTLPRETVAAFGGTVCVRTLTGAERETFVSGYDAHRKAGTIRAALLVACVCDDAGKPLFAAADVPALNELSGVEVERCFDAACRLNGFGAKAEADLRGN
jgi:hypothetical protein